MDECQVIPKSAGILCVSGGLDSIIAWYYLGKPECIFFRTNVKSNEREFQAVSRLIPPGSLIVDTSLNFSQHKAIYIPHRNLLFASRASVHNDLVWIAGLKDDDVEDKTDSAFMLMSDTLTKIGKRPVNVKSPFWDFTKADIIEWGKKNILDFDLICNISVSCYAGGLNLEPCCKCEACFRKACAMYNAGLPYKFDNGLMVQEYMEKALRRKYVTERCLDILCFAHHYFGPPKRRACDE